MTNKNTMPLSQPKRVLVVFPSSDDASLQLYAVAPEGMPAKAARRLANEVIVVCNREDRDNIDSLKDGVCDDGLCVQESIAARLTKMGFEFIEAPDCRVTTLAWDQFHEENEVEFAESCAEQKRAQGGECPNCGADIPARELAAACAECGALPPF